MRSGFRVKMLRSLEFGAWGFVVCLESHMNAVEKLRMQAVCAETLQPCLSFSHALTTWVHNCTRINHASWSMAEAIFFGASWAKQLRRSAWAFISSVGPQFSQEKIRKQWLLAVGME